MHRVVIVGGGFAGVRAALDLAKAKHEDLSVTLISDREHFEYHAALYRVVAGRGAGEVCIPLAKIFAKTKVDLAIDTATTIDLTEKLVHGHSSSTYHYDSLIIALGSETAYFNIPGLKQFAFGFKSIKEATSLKAHLHQVVEELQGRSASIAGRIEVIGGGASGVELAGELAVYLKRITKKHKMPASQIELDLIEAAPRILPLLPEDVSERATQRLKDLGVRVLTSKSVVKEEIETLYLKDAEISSKTVIWTAGVKAHQLLTTTLGLPLDQRGRVEVDEYLQAQKLPGVYAIGDVAVTKYGGMAQTAVDQGRVAADNILRSISHQHLLSYKPRLPVYAIPIGPGWAAVLEGNKRLYGSAGWSRRRKLDWQFFRTILSLKDTVTAYREGQQFSETCPECKD